MRKSIVLAVAVGTTSLFISTEAQATTGTWGGGNGNWSSTTGPAGWTNGTAPNGQGDIAIDSVAASCTTTQDVVGGVTVGTIKANFTSNNSWQITPTNNVIFNQDGAGPLSASIINDIQSTGATGNPSIFLNDVVTSQYILQDDLFISNTSNSQRTNGSIQIKGPITGAGNIWIENVSNDIGKGQIAFTQSESRTGIGGFAGNVTIASGATTFTRGDIFTPSPGNFVTIGAAGKGNATAAFASTALGNMENNFIVAANTGGTSVLGDSTAATGLVNFKSTNSFAASFTLNGDISFSSIGTGTSTLQIGDPITGVGKVTKIGSAPMRVTNANSYQGGTEVVAGSLSVGHTDAINNGFGFYVATDGTLGTGNVTVDSTATNLEIESLLAAVNVIANTATVSLAGGGTLGTADQGYALLDPGINEVVGGLVLGGTTQSNGLTYGSTSSTALIKSDEYFANTGILQVGLLGDFNGNGAVDAADYVLWRKNPTAYGDSASYDVWKQNFGAVAAPGAGSGVGLGNRAVPEPGTLLLAVAGVSLTYASRRRR